MNQQVTPGAKRPRGRPPGSRADTIILKGAARAFAEHGYHLCRVEHILASAGVSRTHFYRFFKNKEQVFERLVERELSYVQRAIDQVVEQFPELSPQERLRLLVEKDVEVAMEAGPFLQVLLVEALHLNEHRSRLEESDEYFCRLIADAVVSMGCPEPDALLVKSLLAASRTILVDVSGSELKAEDKQRRAAELIMRLMSVLLTPE